MNWWPRTLMGRLLLILLGGLLIAQGLSVLVHTRDREGFAFRFSSGRMAQRMADVSRALTVLPASERPKVAASFSHPRFQIRMVSQPLPMPEGGNPVWRTEFMEMLEREAGPGPAMPPIEVWADKVSSSGQREMYRVVAQLRLADGEVAHFQMSIPDRPARSDRLIWHLVIVLAVMLVLCVVAVRLVTKPLSVLARGAEELGRNINRQPMPEQGPLEVQRAARAFNTMQDQLLRHVRSREHLLAAMSHDLKTPITRMALRAEMLEEPSLQARFIDDLQEMESMVGATLDFLRGLDSDEPSKPLDGQALLESLVEDYRATGQQVTLVAEQVGVIAARPLALKRCLQNLIDNALKYAGGAEVQARAVDGGLRVEVLDQGPGIPEADLQRVLDPYVRLEPSRNRETGGHGLGLAIVKNIVEAHGGRLTLENRAEGGLRVVLWLPRLAP